MGRLNRFDLNRIITDYGTACLFETGTLWGDGIAYALSAPFRNIFSVEIMPEIAAKAKHRFTTEYKVHIIHADSVSAMKDRLPAIRHNIIFWLDAHFPGADAGMKLYNQESNQQLRLPLEEEIKTICSLRKGFQDVFIIDDLRIYEDGPYENGNAPSDVLPRANRNIEFIYDCFRDTHVILKSYADEGYLLLFPKNRYKKKHSKWFNLFRRKPETNPNYFVEEL
ncbi:MAG: hypothetical protein JST02_02425 [Bacteroidetes bacterium]|nr:hypothetical protein [Bacteroidota bacterium]